MNYYEPDKEVTIMNMDDYQFLAVAFDGRDAAGKALEKINKLKKEGAIKYKDAVAIHKKDNGKVKLIQTKEKSGILGGGVAGLLVGFLIGGPIVGAAIGALAGGMTHRGLSNKELKAIGEELSTDESALFVVATRAEWDKVEEGLPEYKAILFREVLPLEVIVGLEKTQENYEMANAVHEELTSEE